MRFEEKERQESDDQAKRGTAAFKIEVGRWQGVERKERICKECQSEEVEDVCHWLLQCPAWDHLRRPLVEGVSQCDCFRVSPSRRPLFWLQHALIILVSIISAQCGMQGLVYDS